MFAIRTLRHSSIIQRRDNRPCHFVPLAATTYVLDNDFLPLLFILAHKQALAAIAFSQPDGDFPVIQRFFFGRIKAAVSAAVCKDAVLRR